jgi:hypothetical protein
VALARQMGLGAHRSPEAKKTLEAGASPGHELRQHEKQ